MAVSGSLAYVGSGSGIDVVDVSNATSPNVLSTFGSSDFPGITVVALQVSSGNLVALVQNSAGDAESLLIYSLANPSSPTLMGQTPITISGGIPSHLTGFTISNNYVYTSSFWYRYTISSDQIFSQFGESIVININDPVNPSVAGVIFNDPPDSSTGYPDGTSNTWQTAAVNSDVLLVGTTSATGSVVGSSPQGLVMVVDTTSPASTSVIEKLAIPGMAVVTGISVQGSRALVIGSSQDWGSASSGLAGNVVVAVLDVSQATNPTIVSTRTLGVASIGASFVQYLGNNLYATDSLAGNNLGPELLVFDASDPQNVTVTQVDVANNVGATGFVAAGGLLFTADGSSLSIYNIVAGQDTPVTAQVTIPAGNGVSIVPGSFSEAPTSTTTNPDGSQTLEWNLDLSSASSSQTITWQSNVTGLEPNQSVTVADDATVQFVSGVAASTLNLPDQIVTGIGFIGIGPSTQTVAPATAASYDVTLANPMNSAVTYTLSVQGVPAGWASLAPSVTVGANQSTDVPLILTPAAFATGSYAFNVSATAADGRSASVGASLVVQGQPVISPDSLGVVLTLTPSEATAGAGTAAQYSLQVTNVGSADDTYSLAFSGLPQGVTAALSRSSIDVPPGASNVRDIAFQLSVAPGTPAGTYPFTLTATSTQHATEAGTATAPSW